MTEQETTKKPRNSKVKQLEAELAEMKNSQAEMMDKFSAMMSMMQTFMGSTQTEKVEETPKPIKPKKSIVDRYADEDIPDAPRSDEMILVCSLCRGELNLKNGRGGILKFSRYGEIRPVMYSQLVDVVNSNRGFAEAGDFYVTNPAAVYHLGLREAYKHIYPLEVLNNIENYDSDEITEILNSMCKQQKKTVVINIVTKLYNDEDVNQNKVKLIARLCDVDIHEMVRMMHTVDDNMSSSD